MNLLVSACFYKAAFPPERTVTRGQFQARRRADEEPSHLNITFLLLLILQYGVETRLGILERTEN